MSWTRVCHRWERERECRCWKQRGCREVKGTVRAGWVGYNAIMYDGEEAGVPCAGGGPFSHTVGHSE